jgi:hypothetical protein
VFKTFFLNAHEGRFTYRHLMTVYKRKTTVETGYTRGQNRHFKSTLLNASHFCKIILFFHAETLIKEHCQQTVAKKLREFGKKTRRENCLTTKSGMNGFLVCKDNDKSRFEFPAMSRL